MKRTLAENVIVDRVKTISVCLAAVLTSLGLHAKTLTWVGVDQQGDISSAANWQDEGGQACAPSPGDTLTFASAVTNLTGSFDVGTAGLTLSKTAQISSRVIFTGSGDLTLNGTGTFEHFTASTAFTGDWLVNGCTLSVRCSTQDCLGTGAIHLRTASNIQPTLWVSFGRLSNDIYVHDKIAREDGIRSNNPSVLTGTIYAEADFTIFCGWSGLNNYFNLMNISAAGHTVTVKSWNNEAKRAIRINGKVDANVVVVGDGNSLYLNGENMSADATVTVNSGTLVMTENARWEIASLRVKPGAGLQFAGVTPLGMATALTLDDATATLGLATTFAHVGSLKVGETSYPAGLYGAGGTLPVLSGEGRLHVGANAAYWVGGETGAWSADANWSSGAAPRDGGLAVFTNAAELACEAFDFGAGGVTVCNDGVDLVQCTMFSGSGPYAKFGTGRIRYAAESSYTGETILGDGIADAHTPYTNLVFGAKQNTVRLLRNNAGSYAQVLGGFWNIYLPYHFVIEGALTSDWPRFWIGNCLFVTDEGSVTSDSDFRIHNQWGQTELNCPVTAAGHTITFTGEINKLDGKDTGYTSYFAKAVNASIDKQGTNRLRLDGVSPWAENRLAVNGGTLTLNTNAQWGGTNVTVAANALLVLKGRENLSETATLAIAANGKVEVAAGVTVRVGRLVAGGVEKACGRYSASNLGDYITGGGVVKVGESGLVVTFR